MLGRLDMRKLPLLYHPGISFLYSFFLRVCVYVYGAEHGIGIMLLRCAYHFTFQKRGNYIADAARHCMCIVSKITDGFILPFWRGFPHEEKVKLQHVICTTVKELEKKNKKQLAQI